ncbi:coordinator of PRMT5 and differentiation stimulator [Colius striatus]|uniref:coordinator of PRMT5 and differentiation stimulator n=1 Tax=Colius striatus TaxID=57412 RepID=UPI002B1DB26B|nr:coordinator of PRMT5 and differentiation stimulator [Colius striatus]
MWKGRSAARPEAEAEAAACPRAVPRSDRVAPRPAGAEEPAAAFRGFSCSRFPSEPGGARGRWLPGAHALPPGPGAEGPARAALQGGNGRTDGRSLLTAVPRPGTPSPPADMARHEAPPPWQVMAAAIDSISFDEEQLPNKRETMTWKPQKEYLLKNIPNVLDSEFEESEFSDTCHDEGDVSGFPFDSGDLEDLDGEVSSMPVAVTFSKLQTSSELEDWDKELEDSECSPYDDGDLHCGSFQENNLLASYSWQEDSFYNPGCHHAACIAFTPPVRVTVFGQFDDADE